MTTEKPAPLAVIEQELSRATARMAMLVPKPFAKNYDATRQIMQFAIEASKTPALLQCSPLSVKLAFYHAAALGLEVGSVLGHAYLVPFGTTCTLIPGFRGLIYAAVRSGACRQIWAETVHENDIFAVKLGTDPKIEHTRPLGDRGEPIGAYACARLHGGGTQFVVLDHDEIERVRAASRSGKSGPWASWWEEMAKKTAIRRLAKQLAISTDEQRATFLRAVAIDAEIEGGASPEQVSATLGLSGDVTSPAKPTSGAVLDAALSDLPTSHAEADREIAAEGN